MIMMGTENFGEIFFEVANNLFGIYVAYLQTYLRVFSNLLKPVTRLITDEYLSEHRCKKAVSKIKKRINNTLMSCYFETGSKLLRYWNITLNGSAFRHIFFTYRSSNDYNNDSFKILNLK